MTDSTADSTTDAPQVLTTTTAAGPAPAQPTSLGDPALETDDTADSTDHPESFEPFSGTVPVADAENGEEHPAQAGYVPDVRALETANGEPLVFAHELSELVGHLTGKWIDERTIASYFAAFGAQVQGRAVREVAFTIANTEVPSQIAGDPGLLLLDFRNEIVGDLRKRIGL